MAKLIRQKSTQQVGPVGVVRMTGLRSQAEAWGETGKAAESIGKVFTQELGEDRKRQANEDWAKYLNDPETNLFGAIRKNAKGEAMYTADADGVPTELPPHLQQKQRMDEGIFSNSYTKEINRLANDHNKNLAINDINSYLDGQFSSQKADSKWNPSAFNKNATAYIQETLKGVSPAVQAEVLNNAVSKQSLYFNSIQQNAILKTKADAIASKTRLADQRTGQARDSIANSALGLNLDMGAQRQVATAFQDQLDLSASIGEDAVARGKRIDSFNMTMANGQIQGEVTMLGSDADGFTAEDNVKMAEYLDGLISGQAKITGAFVNPETGQLEIREGTIGEMIPNLDDRQTMFANLGNVIKTKRDNWIARENLYENQQTAVINGLQEQLYLAIANDNTARIQEIQQDILEWQQGLKGNKATELAKKGSYSYLWAKGQLSEQYKDVIAEGYAKGLANINSMKIQQLSPDQLEIYMETYKLNDEEHQQALRDGGWDVMYADQKKKNATLNAMLAADKPSAADTEYKRLVVNPDADGAQTKPLGIIAGTKADMAAGGEYKPLAPDADGNVSWERDWSIIGDQVTATKIIPYQLQSRVAAAFSQKDALTIVNSARLVMEMRENGVTPDNLKKALGDDSYIALNEVIKKLTTTSELALSQETLDRALMYYDPATRPLMKWDSELKRDADKYLKTAHESILPFGMGDEPAYPERMKQDILTRMKIAVEKGEAADVPSAYDIAYNEVVKTRKMWGDSKYGVKGQWTKYPIENVFSGFGPTQLNKVVTQSMLNAAGNMVRIGTGENEVNLLTDFKMPEGTFTKGVYGYMEQVKEMQQATADGGYRLAFTHVSGTGTNSKYRAVVQAADGSLQPVYDLKGNEVQIDIGQVYNTFMEGKQSIETIDAQIKDLEAKYAYLDNYPLHLGSAGAVGYATDRRMDKMREWQEAKEDIRALNDIKARLNRATDIVDDDEIMAISKGNILDVIRKVRSEITSMPEDEYKSYEGLDREGKLQWMRDRGLLME